MKQEAHELINEMFMSTSFPAHLLVEGDSDYALFRQHVFGKNTLNILPVHGSDQVLACHDAFLEAVAKVPNGRIMHAHFFIDLDYRSALGKMKESSLISTTRLKDIECEMIESAAFDTVSIELSCPKKLTKYKFDCSRQRDSIISAAQKIGAIRFASEKSNRKISFDDLNPTKFFDAQTFEIDTSKLAAHLAGKNKHATISAQTIAKDIADAEKNSHFSNPLNLCSGHDLTLLFSAALRGFWRSKNHPTACSHGDIETLLRASFKEDFRRTQCFKSVHSWFISATNNAGGMSSPIV